MPDGKPEQRCDCLLVHQESGWSSAENTFLDWLVLFLGDGHAAEGDGELTGDALETSMDVEFTVDVIPEKGIGGPRAENDEYLMVLGIGNSLPDALRRATTELADWLADDFMLNPSEVAIVLGFALRYDIAEVVDPHVNLVAKVKKSALSHIRK